MSESLFAFEINMIKYLDEFKNKYYDNHIENPEQYPLVMEHGNEGLWLEFSLII